MTTPLSIPSARFLELLRKGKAVTAQDAREYGVLSAVKAASELLAAGHAVSGGFDSRVSAVVWTLAAPATKPAPKPGGVKRSERVAVREAKIEALMSDGQWRTIHEIGCGIGCDDSTVRIRDAVSSLRARSDVFDFQRRECVDKLSGHWEFRIVRRPT